MFSEGKAIKVDLLSPHQNLEFSQKSAMVSYTLASRLTEFTFTNIPIIFHSTKLVKAALPKTVDITLKGEKEFIKNLDRNLIQVIAKVPSDSEGKISVELRTNLPEGAELVKLGNEKISITLTTL